jgi:hypothetical protein
MYAYLRVAGIGHFVLWRPRADNAILRPFAHYWRNLIPNH